MGTVARVVVVTPDEENAHHAIEQAFATIKHLESLMSDRDPNSQLSYVNQHAFAEPVRVDDAVFEVLIASLEYSRLSEGAFDITIGPLVQLWRTEQSSGIAPSAAAVARAKELVGWQNLILDPSQKTVRFAQEGMKLDLGAIAKGYAVDKALEDLWQLEMSGAMVDIGGNLRCYGKAPRGSRHWRIGLQDPRKDENTVLTLTMDDVAVATSGDYRRFALVDGKSFSHIINPSTAQSAQALSSVTIIAPTAMQADALSTAITVLEEQKGLQLVNAIKGVESILIKEGVFIMSKNADKYIIRRSHNN